MPSILSVPTELNDLVCQYLSTPDLLNLSKTCKTLRLSAFAALLDTITWRYYDSHTDPPIPLLIRTLLSSPSLAKHVKCLHLQSVPREFPCAVLRPANWWKFDVHSKDHHFYEAAMDALDLPDKWKESILIRNDINAMAALLLFQSRALHRLSLDIMFLGHSEWFRDLLDMASSQHDDTPAVFPGLRKLAITCSGDIRALDYVGTHQTHEYPSQCILRLFYLESLIELSISPFNPTPLGRKQNMVPWPLSHPPDLSRLQTLKLSPCHTAELAPIFSLTTNLKVLDLHLSVPASLAPLDLESLSRTLALLRGSLEQLTLRYDLWSDEDADGQDADDEDLHDEDSRVVSAMDVLKGDIEGFASFTQLENLEMPLFFLIGLYPDPKLNFGRRLPPRLRELTLTDDLFGFHAVQWQELEVLEVLVNFFAYSGNGTWETSVPELKELVFDNSEGREEFEFLLGYGYESRSHLASAIRSQGIGCYFNLYPDN